MTTALDWIRSRATVKPSMSEPIDWDGHTYMSEWSFFRGRLPYHMRKELKGAVLISTETELETLRIICTPSGHPTGEVEYSHVVYRRTPQLYTC